jgi:hypothetical protein
MEWDDDREAAWQDERDEEQHRLDDYNGPEPDINNEVPRHTRCLGPVYCDVCASVGSGVRPR